MRKQSTARHTCVSKAQQGKYESCVGIVAMLLCLLPCAISHSTFAVFKAAPPYRYNPSLRP